MLGSRQRELLKEIVEEYIKTARPVGSKSLTKKFKVSSATIRNDMALLEDLGYLEKTHISSGRVPSEAGYRYYVDNLMEAKKISGEDMLKLQTIFNNKNLSLSDAINKSLEIISDITNYTSVTLGANASMNLLEKVEIVPISDNRIIAIVITNLGHVENKQVELSESIDKAELVKTTELINKMLVGTPLNEIGSKLEFDIKPILPDYVKNYKLLYSTFYEALTDFTEERNVKFKGRINMLKQPEFNTVDDVKNIISKLESEDIVSKIEETGDEVKIYIGSESELDENLTVIKTKYNINGNSGTLAIIGPKRMEYERVVSMLEYVKKELEKRYNKESE